MTRKITVVSNKPHRKEIVKAARAARKSKWDRKLHPKENAV